MKKLNSKALLLFVLALLFILTVGAKLLFLLMPLINFCVFIFQRLLTMMIVPLSAISTMSILVKNYFSLISNDNVGTITVLLLSIAPTLMLIYALSHLKLEKKLLNLLLVILYVLIFILFLNGESVIIPILTGIIGIFIYCTINSKAE